MSVNEDVVNHPSHYTAGKYEVIDMIGEIVNHYSGEVAYDLGNAVKYIARAGKKTPDAKEDIEKAIWYLERYLKQSD